MASLSFGTCEPRGAKMQHSCEARLLRVDDEPDAIRVSSGMPSDDANQRFATAGGAAPRPR